MPGPRAEKTHRTRAKNGNFSVVYDAGPATLVRRYQFGSLKVASRFIKGFYSTYTYVRPWKDRVRHNARKRSKVYPEPSWGGPER